ncbi:unnamed protein product [Coregonus sp. 'balchen']|nr:unnamed protein product [Coregonus sp. 'balchen']
MTDKFKMKGYKDKTLDDAMMKISQKPREELLKTKPKKKNNVTIICTKYTKCSEKIKAIMKKHWHILQAYRACYSTKERRYIETLLEGGLLDLLSKNTDP